MAQYLAQSESLRLPPVFVVAQDVLVLLRGTPEALRTDLAAVRVVFSVNGNHVPLEPRRVPGAVVAVLTLVYSPLFVSLADDHGHTAGQAGRAHPAGRAGSGGGGGGSCGAGRARRGLLGRRGGSVRLCPLWLTLLGRGLWLLCVDRQDMATENKRVGNFEVAVAALVEFLGAVGHRVLLQLGRPVEAFTTDGTFVWVVLGVNGDDMALQVTGVGALVVTVGTKVGLILLVRKSVLHQLLLLGEGLETALAFVRHLFAMLRLDVSLEIRGVGRLVVAVKAGVGLLARVRAHVFLQLRGMAEAFSAFHADVGEAFTVDRQQVAIEEPLLGSFIVTELAFVHLVGRPGRLLALGLSMVVLQSVRKQRRLLVELLAAHFTLEGGLAAQSVHLHVVVEAGFLVSGEVAVRTLVLFPGQNLLVVILGVAFQEAS